MKKIGLLLFIIGLISTIHAKKDSSNHSILPLLIDLNKYWEGNLITTNDFQLPTNEKELIQLHLKMVVETLSSKKINHLSLNQKNRRSLLLAKLNEYANQGVFPINSYHYTRTPYFIDDFGTACAVGQLIIESGQVELAEAISNQFNYEYIENMPQEAIQKWAEENGFTVDELKWIQPGYGPSCAMGTYRDACANSICGCLYPNLSQLPGVSSLVSEYDDSTGWVVDSLNLWFTMDCARIGNHRITVIDTLNNTHVFNYTIGQKAPINPVIQITNPTQNCNGSIIANGSQGFYHYLRLLNNTFNTSNFSGSFTNLCSGVYEMYISDSGYFCTRYYNITLNLSTGINEEEELMYVRFQNPISQTLHLETNLNKTKELSVFDMRGNLVVSQSFNTTTYNQELKLNNGLYLLHLSNGEQVIQKKLLVSN